MTTKTKGDISEAVVMAELLKRGEVVLIPFGDNQRYDLVLDRNGEFLRVQVKTASVSEDGDYVIFRTNSSYVHRGRGKRSYVGDADYFAAYSPDRDEIYWVAVEDAPLTECRLRLTPTANNQQKGIRWAKDYKL